MRRMLGTCACVVLALIALAAAAMAAQAETKTLVSSEANSLCVNPVKGFKPKKNSRELNYAPLLESNPGGGPFPDTGKACEAGTPSHPVAMAAPGQPAGPYHGSISGASWVSIVPSGSDASNPPPRYYIYDATFELCASQLAAASISGTMFADNIASAYLNGELIGRQPYAGLVENFDGPPAGGWPFGPATSPFRAGVNTLQFVVLDETIAYTGLDFSATVTAPASECEATEFPGLGRCAKVKDGGGYESSSCETEATGGKYEWLAGAVKNKFKSKEGLSTFTTVGAKTLTCKSDTDAGEYVGESEDLETITFKDCDIPGRECTNEPGGFETKRLRSLYGFITKPTVAGVSLQPVSGTTVAEFTCGGESGSISGSVIAPVTPVSAMTKTFTETFKGSGGLQAPENFEGEPKDTLACVIPPSGSAEQCALTSTDKVTNEEKLEIRLAP